MSWGRLAWVLIGGLGLGASVANAQQHPNLERGFRPEHLYHFDDLDSVNLFNGNLSIRIPLGGSYPVGGAVSYQLTLVYNSKVWDIEGRSLGNGQTAIAALPARRANAGLGWLVSLGRVIGPDDPTNETPYSPKKWVYAGPDGADRIFYEAAGGVSYTRDGSYLRMRAVGVDREVDFPDGTIHRFNLVAGSNPARYRLVQIRDRLIVPNKLDVEYSPDELIWTIRDSHGREHLVTFEAAWSDNQPIKIVDTVRIEGFGGLEEYDFTYQQTVVERSGDAFSSCLHTDPEVGTTTSVPLLTSVKLPDNSLYQFTYFLTDPSFSCGAGALSSLTLPTLGRFQWTYARYELPSEECVDISDPNPNSYQSKSPGVLSKTIFDANGTQTGAWGYGISVQHPQGPTEDCPDPQTDPPGQEVLQEVTTPLGDKHRYYFSAWAWGLNESPDGFRKADYGLPFTRLATDGSNPSRFLSTATDDCAGAICTLNREEYVRYEQDSDCGFTAPLSECMDSNRRLSSSRKVFVDDGSRHQTVDFSDFDGVGHYRASSHQSNFGAGDSRSTFTNFNSIPAPAAPWVLGIYTEASATEGAVTQKSEFCFNPTTGFLERKRTLKTGVTRGANDLVVRYTDEQGNVGREEYFGGDTQGLNTNAAVCALGLPATPQFVLDRDWQCGVPKAARYLEANGASVGFESEDYDIHCESGLIQASRDTAGLLTSFEYGTMGRLRFAKPQAAHGAWTEYLYTRATSAAALAKVNIYRRPNGGGTALAESQVLFDSLGRVASEEQKMPSGSFSARKTTYNAQGWKFFVTELGSANKGTTYLDYDPFGRPGKIQPADGAAHEVALTYAGARVVNRTVKVGTAWNGTAVTESASMTTETYDGQGRLWKVTEPSGTAGANVTTTYSYDVGGRLSQASTGAQTRTFTYDNLGFLRWENHPEKTANSHGQGHDVDYPSYDALGHALGKVEGANDLTFVYDRAGRLGTARETGGQQRTLKSFAYAGQNVPGEKSLGKLRKATRYNYVTAGVCGQSHTAAIEEEYTYGGLGGRVSARRTQLTFDGVANETFDQGFSYTQLGLPLTLDYPECTFCTAALPRAVTNTYTHGRLTGVTGYATGLAYHSNGMLNTVTHGNAVIDTQANDQNGMPRPSEISAAPSGGAKLWSTGVNTPYAYDGAGNVTRMGGSRFLYDPVSRLKDGTVTLGALGESGGTRTQALTYDSFGNIQSIAGSIPHVTTTSSATNRLTADAATYDAAGNLLSTTDQTFAYDAFNQPWYVHAGGEDWLHFYTADDERVWSYKVGASPLNRWTLRDLGGKVLREYLADGVGWRVERDYIYRDGLLLAAETPAGVRHFHLDHLGTPRAITDSAGTRLSYHVYLPFGEEATSTTQDTERLKFTGHERDLHGASTAADDLDYMHARYYRPGLGRLLSVDPAIGSAKLLQPQTWNRYSYSLGNPIRYVDSDGKDAWDVISWKISAAEWSKAATAFLENPSLSNGVVAVAKFLDNAYDSAAMLVPGLPGGAGLLGKADDAVAVAAKTIANPVPSTMARVIPEGIPATTIGPPGAADVFVTAADDIAGMNASQIANRLGIGQSPTGFRVFEFPTPQSGVASPVFRTDPGFIGGGRTIGGAREFVIPNGPIPPGAIRTVP